MKTYYMTFDVEGVTMYATEMYDNPQSALEEAKHCRHRVLENLSCRSDNLDYDSQYGDDSDENEFAVSLFDSWMQEAGGAIETVEDYGSYEMTYYDIEIYFLGKEIYTFPQLLLPEDV